MSLKLYRDLSKLVNPEDSIAQRSTPMADNLCEVKCISPVHQWADAAKRKLKVPGVVLKSVFWFEVIIKTN
jgi:hypothetical protein